MARTCDSTSKRFGKSPKPWLKFWMQNWVNCSSFYLNSLSLWSFSVFICEIVSYNSTILSFIFFISSPSLLNFITFSLISFLFSARTPENLDTFSSNYFFYFFSNSISSSDSFLLVYRLVTVSSSYFILFLLYSSFFSQFLQFFSAADFSSCFSSSLERMVIVEDFKVLLGDPSLLDCWGKCLYFFSPFLGDLTSFWLIVLMLVELALCISLF